MIAPPDPPSQVGDPITDLLTIHRNTLERYRQRMNLVGPGPVDLHYADCAEAVRGLDPQGQWADLGTGAGFPGVVLAAQYPELHLDLVDSRRKRCAFLEQVLAQAAAPPRVRVVCAREPPRVRASRMDE